MKMISRSASAITLLIACLCLSLTGRVFAQGASATPAALKTKVSKNELIARLENVIPRLMKEGEVPGLSIALIRNSEILWHRGFGVKNAETKEPAGNDTVFEAASLSKPVFAYAVLKLADSGKLDLDAPLAKYLPAPYIENEDRLNLITARRVLTHTTGFPNWRPQGQPLKIHFTPGERFSYSGEGFVYLQTVIERLTGQPLDAFISKTVFEPLAMTSSSFVWQDRYETLKATAHNSAGTPTSKRKPPQANAAASLHTTAADYARFVIAIINGAGLKKETIKAMLSPQVKVDEGCANCVNNIPTGRLSSSIAWGLGWGLQQTEEGVSFWHWGDNNGDVHCYVVGFPAQKMGVVVFTNSGNGHSIIPEIINEAIGGKHPAIAWLKYESYNSPSRKLFRDVLARGDAAINEYKESRKNLSPPALLSESQVNRLGYWLIAKKKTKEAIEVFKMNVEDHPDSSNVYDSLGEAYMINGDKELAVRHYQKSVELNPNNANGIQMLKKLREQ
ncbi:MAG TPA: serine hydrolase [Blastocatellia bacterium]|nr:serine hydrolase [Blastocatellia bacterium]